MQAFHIKTFWPFSGTFWMVLNIDFHKRNTVSRKWIKRCRALIKELFWCWVIFTGGFFYCTSESVCISTAKIFISLQVNPLTLWLGEFSLLIRVKVLQLDMEKNQRYWEMTLKFFLASLILKYIYAKLWKWIKWIK